MMKKRTLVILLGIAALVSLLAATGSVMLPADGIYQDDGGEGEDDCNPTHPQIARIAAEYGVSEDEIAGWFCEGYNIGTIKQVYRTADAVGAEPAEIFDMLEQDMNWGEILQELGIEDDDLDDEDEDDLDDEDEDDLDDEDDDGDRCSGGMPSAQIERMAARYGVDAEVIEDLFCAGYGLGNIKNMYEAAADTGVPAEDILEMMEEGESWGAIRQELELSGSGKLPPPPPDPLDEEACEAFYDNPQIIALAEQYEVDAEEVAGLYCQGYDFKDIQRAYSFGALLEAPAEYVLQIRAQGAGWGEMKKLVYVAPEELPEPEETPEP